MKKLHGVEMNVGDTRKDQRNQNWELIELDAEKTKWPFLFRCEDGHTIWFGRRGVSNIHGNGFDAILQPNKPKRKAKA